MDGHANQNKAWVLCKTRTFCGGNPAYTPAFQTIADRQASADKRAVAKVKVLAIYGNDFLFNRPTTEFALNIG